ncbi:AAA family ATPase [Clostridium sp. MCC353]|nr:AAA family ATPase [Clostridium sp. MCC353]MBT9775948.1 AAA family ATPase [Clostridium sp. MCC353]
MDDKFIREIRIRKDEIAEDSYLQEIPAVRSMDVLRFQKPVTFFVGENGSGKSTLLEGIAVAYGFNPEGGTRNFNFSTNDTHSELGRSLFVLKGIKRPWDEFFLRAESFYNVATQIDEYERERSGYLKYYGGKSLHQQSHGESFLSLVQNRFSANGLYILDEPEAALSPQRQLTLLLLIHELVKKGSQFIIATHSPILLGIPDAQIFSLDNDMFREIQYEEAECYQVMKIFINEKEGFLKQLLQEE